MHRLNGTEGHKHSVVSIVFAYALTDYSSDDKNDTFYKKLSNLQNTKCSNVVVVAGKSNTQVRRLTQAGRHLIVSLGDSRQ